MTAVPRFPGRELNLGGRVFVMPALSLGAIEELEESFTTFQRKPIRDQMKFIVDVALRALRRNYPDLERAELAELIDTRNAFDVFGAVMGVSGLVPVEGEANPLQTASPGTGSPSTPISPLPSAGPSSTAEST